MFLELQTIMAAFLDAVAVVGIGNQFYSVQSQGYAVRRRRTIYSS